MSNAVFEKAMENVRKHRDIKLVTTDKRRNQLVPEPNYHTTKWFSENLLAIEMKKTKVKMNKPVYLGLTILEIIKTLMHECWCDYMKPKYGDISIKILLMMLKKDLIHQIMKSIDHYLQEKIKKVVGLTKDGLGGKIITEFVALRAKTNSCLMDDDRSDKKAKGTKKCVIKRILKFNDYKDCC